MNRFSANHPSRWVEVRPEGLYVPAADLYIDPARGVARAAVTHAHSDHARPGHAAVLGTPETLAIMRQRLGDQAGGTHQALGYGQPLDIGDVRLTLVPAGHVLGSAQVVIEHEGARLVVSGDYKREPDPTCAPFEPVRCDVFVTEATFALPVFHHPDPMAEIGRLTDSLALFPDRAHVVGVYALGKCQRLLALLRAAGHDRPIYLHGALMAVTELYQRFGQDFGDVRPATGIDKGELAGSIVLAPPSAIADRWARRLPDPRVAAASGWMRVRQRAKQRGVELPLVISDHADWPALLQTCEEVEAGEVWITHGREEALAHALSQRGIAARALALAGREDEDLD